MNTLQVDGDPLRQAVMQVDKADLLNIERNQSKPANHIRLDTRLMAGGEDVVQRWGLAYVGRNYNGHKNKEDTR